MGRDRGRNKGNEKREEKGRERRWPLQTHFLSALAIHTPVAWLCHWDYTNIAIQVPHPYSTALDQFHCSMSVFITLHSYIK